MRVSKRSGHCVGFQFNGLLMSTRRYTHMGRYKKRVSAVPFMGVPAIISSLFLSSSPSSLLKPFLSEDFMGLFLSRNLARKLFFPFIFSQNVPRNLFPKQLENMVSLVSRTGRHLQRYDKGCRQVVGCIPYRYRKTNVDGILNKELEVLVISAQNGHGMQFPKGGWEIDESMEQAALRETLEEAGVVGSVERTLGKWTYKSKRQATVHEGYMFPLLVQKQLEDWPEKNIRKRRWMTVAEARDVCPHTWMKEALDELVCRQIHVQQKQAAYEY